MGRHLASGMLVACTLPLAAAPLEVRVTDPAGKPLAGVVVFAESPEAKAALKPAAGIEIAQTGKQFVPPVTVIPTGTAVSFPNRDTVRHHVYSFSPAKKFEIKLYVGTPANPVVFDQPGIAVLGCNIHDHMVAWVVIVDTPYFAQTGADGKVNFPNLPAGGYRLRAWHAGLPVGATPTDQALQMGAGAQQAVVTLAGPK
ncbi:methylamine utilization protein [Aquabacterium humicola]|uniref:methylamine utilization protein n=1 Tax=Aquabacterium humicola TaxID=3237377 RepID=UPI003F74E134